jgi:hypothetical protein
MISQKCTTKDLGTCPELLVVDMDMPSAQRAAVLLTRLHLHKSVIPLYNIHLLFSSSLEAGPDVPLKARGGAGGMLQVEGFFIAIYLPTLAFEKINLFQITPLGHKSISNFATRKKELTVVRWVTFHPIKRMG